MNDSNFGTANLLTEAHNYAVVQLPGRKFPGVVFQGDSLHSLREHLRLLVELTDPDELRQGVRDVGDDLDQILREYVAVIDDRGGSLPFPYPT